MGEEYSCSAREFSNNFEDGRMVCVPYCRIKMFNCDYAVARENGGILVCSLGSKNDCRTIIIDPSSIDDSMPEI